MPLTDQVVLITGCSTGIGRALATELGARGHRVFATARRPETIADLPGAPSDKLRLDVTDRASVDEAVAHVMDAAGRIDMVINNAGINVIGPLAELPLGRFRDLFETNVTGLLSVVQAVFPHMSARRRGRIVNIGSVVGVLPTPFAGAYCATKAAVHILSEVLRMEVSPFGIDVVVVQPGAVESSIADTASQGLERYAADDSAYRAAFDGIKKRAQASQEAPMNANAFARQILDQVLAERAPRIVRGGGGASILPHLARLPGPLLDRALSRRFGLDKLHG